MVALSCRIRIPLRPVPGTVYNNVLSFNLRPLGSPYPTLAAVTGGHPASRLGKRVPWGWGMVMDLRPDVRALGFPIPAPAAATEGPPASRITEWDECPGDEGTVIDLRLGVRTLGSPVPTLSAATEGPQLPVSLSGTGALGDWGMMIDLEYIMNGSVTSASLLAMLWLPIHLGARSRSTGENCFPAVSRSACANAT